MNKTKLKIALLTLMTMGISAKEVKAQDKNKEKPKITWNGVSLTPAAFGIEFTKDGLLTYRMHDIGTSFSLNTNSKINPFFGMTGGISSLNLPKTDINIKSRRICATIGAGMPIGKVYISTSANAGISKGNNFVYNIGAAASLPVCKIGNHIRVNAFAAAYGERIKNISPFTPGMMAGLSVNFR